MVAGAAALLGSTVASTAVASAATARSAGKTITYLYFTNGPDLNATKTLIARFEKQTGDTINLNVVPYASEAQILQADLSAGDPPALVETTMPATFGTNLVDLGTALGKSWVSTLAPSLLGQAVFHNKIVALPNQLTVAGPFVNVAMFKKAGVGVPSLSKGWTWSQMVADAEKVAKANGTPFALAMDHSGARTANVFCQFGAFLFGSNGKEAMSGPAALKAMTYLSGLFEKNVISKAAWIAAGSAYASGATEFLAKQAPVLLSGSWQVASFLQSAPFAWQAVPNPRAKFGGAMSGGNYLEVFKKSNDPAVAEQFVKFLSEPQNQSYMSVLSDTIPSSRSLSTPGSVPFKGSAKVAMETFTQGATLMPAGCNLSEANPGFGVTSSDLMGQLTSVMAGQTSATAAVNNVLKVARVNNGV